MRNIAVILLLLAAKPAFAQSSFSRKDSLQGGLGVERTCYDVVRYDLNVKVNTDNQTISGSNDITFKVVMPTKRIQVDLFQNMQIDSIIFNGKPLTYSR